MGSLILFTVLFFATPQALAAEIDVPGVGKHTRLLTIEKSENPQNVMRVYTKLDEQCRFARDPADRSRPLVDFYWLMDRTRYKPVHPLIKSGVRKRVRVDALVSSGPPGAPVTPGAKKTESFTMRLEDLKELKTDLPEAALNVTARRTSKGCDVSVVTRLGPSDGFETLRLEKIHTESRKSLLPPFRKLVSVTLEGLAATTGDELRRTYVARR